ncbi:MAG: 50S ribosomal protein L29, partial [bacterium]
MRLQAQTEKLAAPSEVKKHRRTIARCQTILTQRGVSLGAAATGAEGQDSPQHETHAKRRRASGRAKVPAPGQGGVASRRTFRTRTKSGTSRGADQ